eukprot:gene5747-6331_t
MKALALRFVLVLLSLDWLCASSSLVTLFSSVLRPRGPSRRSSSERQEVTNRLDQFGDIPALRYALQALDQAQSVAVLRLADNSTLVGLLSDYEQRLQVSIGSQHLKALDPPHLHLLVTGFAGDSRSLLRYARQLVVNHTLDYDSGPSGRWVAHRLGRWLQENVRSHQRPYVVHFFVIETFAERRGKIYEVNAAGSVQEVRAGVAGRQAGQAVDKIFQHLSQQPVLIDNRGGEIADEKEGRRLLEEIWQKQLGDMSKRKVLRLFHLSAAPPSPHNANN